ncbi:hypothetical protein [Paenibacillus aquistagni]|uniref:hypothetical protein n=1 Tax=Paenibacillus aquistagni TaxID=1852522 RepID=UPI00145A3A09|nr:hypothetical protein [Paenibacillus aquistagni]NMM52128.1 hypothetical protein [Paenibacillus aquistagni]
MQFEGAVIKEQGVTFAIIVVKYQVLNTPSRRSEIQAFGVRTFGQMPIVLMAQDSSGIPKYYGRPDIVRFLANVHPSRIPWHTYTIS